MLSVWRKSRWMTAPQFKAVDMVGLARETQGSGPIITHIGASGFRTKHGTYSGGLILSPETEQAWDAPAIAALHAAHFGDFLAMDPPPEFVLLGTGQQLTHPPTAFVAELEAQGIGLEVMDSAAAARAWSLLRSEGRWIFAVLYPL